MTGSLPLLLLAAWAAFSFLPAQDPGYPVLDPGYASRLCADIPCDKALADTLPVHAIATVLRTGSASAAPGSDFTSSPFLTDGIDAFYDADWKRADMLFREHERQHPEDPRPLFFRSMIPFWTYFFISKSDGSADSFLDLSEQAITLASARLGQSPWDSSMVLMLSGAHGYRSLIFAGEGRYFNAMKDGVAGFGYTRDLMRFGEDRADVRIGRGMYYYMVGSIPTELRWMITVFRGKGTIQMGFDELESAAAERGPVGTEARAILVYLYRKESRMEDALRHLERLTDMHPANPLFHFMQAELLEETGLDESATLSYARVVQLDNPSMLELKERSLERLAVTR